MNPEAHSADDDRDPADNIEDPEVRELVLWVRDLGMFPPWSQQDQSGAPPVDAEQIRLYAAGEGDSRKRQVIGRLIYEYRSWLAWIPMGAQ